VGCFPGLGANWVAKLPATAPDVPEPSHRLVIGFLALFLITALPSAVPEGERVRAGAAWGWWQEMMSMRCNICHAFERWLHSPVRTAGHPLVIHPAIPTLFSDRPRLLKQAEGSGQ